MDDNSDEKVFLVKDLNACLGCKLCNGYFREAHTVTECLHTFCRVCIESEFVRQGRKDRKCPTCQALLGPNPKVIFDRTIQAIVDKLFPVLSQPKLIPEHNHSLKDDSILTTATSIVDSVQSCPNSVDEEEAKSSGNKRKLSEVEEDTHVDDMNMIYIRLIPFEYIGIIANGDEIMIRNNVQFSLPKLSKPTIKLPIGTKISKIQKFIHKRLPLELQTDIKVTDIEIYIETSLPKSVPQNYYEFMSDKKRMEYCEIVKPSTTVSTSYNNSEAIENLHYYTTSSYKEYKNYTKYLDQKKGVTQHAYTEV